MRFAARLGTKSGLVLFSSIVMLAILSLLLLSLMQNLLLFAKINSQRSSQSKAFYQLETASAELVSSKSLLQTASCQRQSTSAEPDLNYLLSPSSCSFVFQHQAFRYYLEDLGEHPCLRIRLDNQEFSSHHSLLYISKPGSGLLRMRIARPGKAQQCESALSKNIAAGVLNWSYFSAEELI